MSRLMQTRFLAALLLALAATAARAQLTAHAPRQFWLAAKFDGRRAMIYFDTLHYGDSLPKNLEFLYPAAGFGVTCLLTEPYARQMQNRPPMPNQPPPVHFSIGEKYDLISEGNFARTATIAQLIGWPGDEFVGNDSYIGALVTLDDPSMPLNEDWMLARRHIEIPPRAAADGSTAPHARLLSEPVAFQIQTRIVSLMKQRIRSMDASPIPPDAENTPLIFAVQSFHLADGDLRYYARCQWNVAKGVTLGAWLAPQPTLHIVGIERRTASYGFDSDLPTLLNVFDLGAGRTAIVLSTSGEDSAAVVLLEYRDRVGGARDMPQLQSLAAAE